MYAPWVRGRRGSVVSLLVVHICTVAVRLYFKRILSVVLPISFTCSTIFIKFRPNITGKYVVIDVKWCIHCSFFIIYKYIAVICGTQRTFRYDNRAYNVNVS